MKIIFLDIDGVLNWRGTSDRIGGYIGLCPKRIERLNRITEAVPDAKIVISSTWRHTFEGEAYKDFAGLVRLLKKRGVKGKIIGKTPKRFSYVPRGQEIREWIDDHKEAQKRARKHKNPIEAIVVLDDDRAGMEGYIATRTQWDDPDEPVYHSIDLRPFHVVTDFDGQPSRGYAEPSLEGGLLDQHVELAIKILGGHRLPVKINPEIPEPEWVTVTEKDLT